MGGHPGKLAPKTAMARDLGHMALPGLQLAALDVGLGQMVDNGPQPRDALQQFNDDGQMPGPDDQVERNLEVSDTLETVEDPWPQQPPVVFQKLHRRPDPDKSRSLPVGVQLPWEVPALQIQPPDHARNEGVLLGQGQQGNRFPPGSGKPERPPYDRCGDAPAPAPGSPASSRGTAPGCFGPSRGSRSRRPARSVGGCRSARWG